MVTGAAPGLSLSITHEDLDDGRAKHSRTDDPSSQSRSERHRPCMLTPCKSSEGSFPVASFNGQRRPLSAGSAGEASTSSAEKSISHYSESRSTRPESGRARPSRFATSCLSLWKWWNSFPLLPNGPSSRPARSSQTWLERWNGSAVIKMAKRIGRTFTRENIGEALAKVCPSDLEMDQEMQRLLDRMGGDPEKDKK